MSKTITTIIITALIFFGLGYLVASRIITTTTQTTGPDTFQAGWQAAKQRLAESGFAPPMLEGMEITSVSGEFKQIKNKQISLNIHPLEPLADPELDNRVIEVDTNTKIYQPIEKDREQYQKEMEEFNRKMQEQMENPEAVVEPFQIRSVVQELGELGVDVPVDGVVDSKVPFRRAIQSQPAVQVMMHHRVPRKALIVHH